MEGTRFRHLAHFARWRDDRRSELCTHEQLEQALTYALGHIVPGLGQANSSPSVDGPSRLTSVRVSPDRGRLDEVLTGRIHRRKYRKLREISVLTASIWV